MRHTDAEQFSVTRVPALRFGTGSAASIGELVRQLDGSRPALITGGKSYEHVQIRGDLEHSLGQLDRGYERFSVSGEPNPDTVDAIRDAAVSSGTDIVVAVGGGSVLDTGKAVAAMCRHNGSVEDYLEGVGEKKPEGFRVPLIAVPTTAGTGSEATKNAVISRVGEKGYKKSLRHDAFVADAAVIDPRAGLSAPPQITAAAGMDAVTQLLEAYVSTGANPFTDALALDGLRRAGAALPLAVSNGADLRARAEMAYAAYLSGIALANAGLGLVHGYASSLGALHPIPHGVICAILVGPVTRKIADALASASDEQSLFALEKYAHAAAVLEAVSSEVVSEGSPSGAAPSPHTVTGRSGPANAGTTGEGKERAWMNDEERREHLRDRVHRLASVLEGWLERFSLPGFAEFGFSEEEIRIGGAAAGLYKSPAALSDTEKAEIVLSSVRA